MIWSKPRCCMNESMGKSVINLGLKHVAKCQRVLQLSQWVEKVNCSADDQPMNQFAQQRWDRLPKTISTESLTEMINWFHECWWKLLSTWTCIEKIEIPITAILRKPPDPSYPSMNRYLYCYSPGCSVFLSNAKTHFFKSYQSGQILAFFRPKWPAWIWPFKFECVSFSTRWILLMSKHSLD